MRIRLYLSLIALLAMLPLTGCASSNLFFPTAQDITNVELMRTIALDQGEKKAVKVTVSGAAKSGADNTEPEPPTVISQEAETVFAACLAMQTKGDNFVSYGAVDQCLIHENAVERELTGLLDYLERDYELRMDAKLFLAVDQPAGDYLKKMATKTNSAADRLESVARDYSLESQGWAVKIQEALVDMAENGCTLLPVVELKEKEDETTIQAAGVAWLTNDGVQGRFQGEQARAAAILSGKADGGSIEAKLSDGTLAGLQLTEVKCTWKSVWEGQTLTGIGCKINVKADIAELQGGADPEDQSVLEEMEKKIEQQLQKELEPVLQEAQENGVDLFHLRQKLMMKSPRKGTALDRHWKEWYPAAAINVQVCAEVERSYDVDRGTEGRT